MSKVKTVVNIAQRWEKSGLKEGKVFRFRMYNRHDVLLHEVITDNPSPQDAKMTIERNKPGSPIVKIDKEEIDYPVRMGYDA